VEAPGASPGPRAANFGYGAGPGRLSGSASESAAEGRRCFRVDGRRFATLHDDRTVHLVLGEADVLAMVAADPGAFQPLYHSNRPG
jgi:hypothetical protein